MSATTKTWLNNNAPSCEDDDLNGFKEENNNLILGSGQSLNTSDRQQSHKAVADYAASGAFYTDSGIADAYALDPIGSHVSPPAYVDGMSVEFIAGNTNTGASTINVAGLGVKSIVNAGSAGAITVGSRYQLRYRSGSGDFEIIISQAISRVWVNFDGTGTIAIRGSINVSSLTDNGLGDYNVNFTNNLVNANYASVMSTVASGEADLGAGQANGTVSTQNIRTRTNSNAPADRDKVTLVIFGD